MSFINVNDEVFNELIKGLNNCKKWGFYNLDNQYKFVEKTLINWCSVYNIDKKVLTELITKTKQFFKPEYCVVYENNKLIETNDIDKINKYYKKKDYSIVQLTLPDRIEKIKLYIISSRS